MSWTSISSQRKRAETVDRVKGGEMNVTHAFVTFARCLWSDRVILQVIQQIYHGWSTAHPAPNCCVHMDLALFSDLSPSRLVDMPEHMQPTTPQLLQPPCQDTTPCSNVSPRLVHDAVRRRVSQQDFRVLRDLGVDSCANTLVPQSMTSWRQSTHQLPHPRSRTGMHRRNIVQQPDERIG